VITVDRTGFVSVPVTDLERAKSFYGETLGLKRHPNSSERWFEIGNVTLALLPHEYTGRSEFTPSSGPSALRVPDVSAARQKLEEAGVEFPAETIDSGVCHIAPSSTRMGTA